MRASIHRLFLRAFLSFIMLSPLAVFAQAGTEFWLTIPELTVSHGIVNNKGGIVKHVVVSTLSSPATVTVSLPADPTFKPIVVDVPANTTERINFEEYNDLLEMLHYDSVTKQGILIESSDVITAYLESMEPRNPDVFTLKGNHSLGKDFYVPFQNFFSVYEFANEVQAYCSIDIVATEDNTVVTIVPTQPVAKRGGGSYAAGETITVTLNRGESYSARSLGFKNTDHLGGTHVTSTKPIAIITKDDSVLAHEGWDLIGDQMVPVSRTGSQYIVMNSGLSTRTYGAENCTEYAYIVPTQDNTSIFVDGVLRGVYNAGENIAIGLKNPYTVISSVNQPFYCFHTVIAKVEIAGAILPPTDQCSGSNQVGFSYSYGKDQQELYMLVMVRKGAEDGFLMDGSPVSWLDASKFTSVSTYWSAAKIGPLNETTLLTGPHVLTNTKDLFHMGYINTTGSGCLYGYYSDFETTDISAVAVKSGSNTATYCSGDPIRLRVDGGINYSWRGYETADPTKDATQYINGPTRYNPTIKTTIPQGKYTFEVTVGNACGGADVKSTVMLEVIPRPAEKTITADYCESEVGGKCADGLDLTSLMPQLVGSETDLEAIKWTREVFDDMQMLNDFDAERNIAVTSATGTVVSGVDNPKPDKINMSAKVLKYAASGATADVRLGSKAGYPFDFATGDIVTMKIFNDRGTSTCNDKTFTLHFFNEGANDTIKVAQVLRDCNKWAVMTFDFSSFNTDKVYTKALLTHTGGWEAHNHYIDDIEKYVNYRVEEIPDASAAQLCNAPTVTVTLENDEGCQITSTINATVKPGDFPINSPFAATVCKDPASTATVGEVDLVATEKDLIGAGGVTAGTKVIKWEGPVFGEVQILDDFDANRNVTWPGPTWQTSVTDTLNPNIGSDNNSATVGLYPGGERDIAFPERINVSEGYIFTIDVCYLAKRDASGNRLVGDRKISMVLVDDAGTKYPAAVASITFRDAIDYTWRRFEFDFSAHASLKGIAKAQLNYDKPWDTYSAYVDNLIRKLEPFTAEMTDPTAVATRDGDKFYATIKNSEGCVVKGEVVVSLKECGPTATDTAIALCEDVRAGGSAAGIDLTQYNDVVQSHIADYTTAWFTDILLKSPVATPTSVTAGNGDIFYAKVSNTAGLFDTAALTVTVRALPAISFPSIDPVCAADTSIAINLASPKGGTYTSASAFYDHDTLFAITDAGTYSVRYAYTDADGCTDSVDQSITVNAVPEIELTTTDFAYCTVSDVDLTIAPETGATYAWYLDGTLMPAQTSNTIVGALKGNYTVEKTVKGCLATKEDIVVEGYGTPPYFYHGADTVCEGNSSPTLSIEITGIAPWELSYTDHNGTAQTVTVAASPYTIPFAETSPALYTFTVTGITDKMGCPADIRTESLHYLIRPAASSPWAASPATSLCVNASPVDLASYVTVPGGVFSGTGVAGNDFDPALSGSGSAKVYYAFEDVNECSALDSIMLEVHSLPVPKFGFIQSACINSSAYPLSAISNDSITSGAFAGTGVAANVFDPAAAGTGAHDISYTYESIHGCKSSASVGITVHALPETKISAGGLLDYCISDAAFTVPVSPAGGILSGKGIVGNQFDPSSAGAGSSEITYYYKDEYGCEQSDKATYTVLFTEPLESKRFSYVVTNIAPVISVAPAAGATVNWYAAASSAPAIYTGADFAHGETTISEKSYWTTQTINGCESARTEIKLSIIDCGTPAPIIDRPDRTICLYSPAETFTAQTVDPSAEVRWYDAGGQLVFTGASFAPDVKVATQYYAVQDTGCQSMAADISIAFTQPAAPVLASSGDLCAGTGHASLSEQSGSTKLYWFDAEPPYPANTAASVSGAIQYSPPAEEPGTYTVWAVSQLNGCLSPSAAINFTIKPIPDAPQIATPATACNRTAPAPAGLTSGDNTDLRWFWDDMLVNAIPATAGSAYSPGALTDAITVYAALETDGCLGKVTAVSFSVYEYVKIPEMYDSAVCHDIGTMPSLMPSNGIPEWQTQWQIAGSSAWSSEPLVPARASASYKMRFVGQGGCKGRETSFNFIYVNPPVPTVSIAPEVLCLGEGGTAEVKVAVSGDRSGTELFAPNTSSADPSTLITVGAQIANHGEYTARSYKIMPGGQTCKSALSAPASLEIRGRLDAPKVDNMADCEKSVFFVIPEAASSSHTLWISPNAWREPKIAFDTQLGGFDLTQEVATANNTFYLWAEHICTSENVPFSITVHPLPASPIITVGGQARIEQAGSQPGQISVCQSDLGIPSVQAASPGATISWLDSLLNNAGSGPDAAQLQVGEPAPGQVYTYKLNTVSDRSCSITEEYQFIVRPLPVPVILDQNGSTLSDTLCVRAPYRTYSIQAFSPGDSYLWLPSAQGLIRLEYPGSTVDNGTMRGVPLAAGIDTLRLQQTLDGCTDTAELQVLIVPQAEPSAHVVLNPLAGQALLYNETAIPYLQDTELPQYFEWNLEGLRIPQTDTAYRQQSPAIWYTQPGEHAAWLIARNSGGGYCADSIRVAFTMPAVTGLYAPSAFSPSSQADLLARWQPAGYGLATYQVWVYDHWGNTVWYSNKLSSSSPAEGWDGRDTNGHPVAGEVFTYRIKARFTDGSVWHNTDGKEYGSIFMFR